MADGAPLDIDLNICDRRRQLRHFRHRSRLGRMECSDFDRFPSFADWNILDRLCAYVADVGVPAYVDGSFVACRGCGRDNFSHDFRLGEKYGDRNRNHDGCPHLGATLDIAWLKLG